MKKIFLVTLIVLFTPFSVSAQSNLDPLLGAKTIRCTIKEGGTSTFNGKKTSFERGAFSKNPEDSVATYTKIDIKHGTALIIGNAGTDDVAVRAGEVGLNFIDFTGVGALITATIFSNRDADGNYFYATSRHTQLSFGETTSMPSQWTGICKIIE